MIQQGEYDLRRRFSPVLAPWIVEVAVAAVMVGVSIAARLIIAYFFKDVVAFALVFPALAAATLLAGGRSGLLVILFGQLLVWYYVLPPQGSLVFTRPSDVVSLILATAAQLLLLWSLTSFRGAADRVAALREERTAELERALDLLQQQTALDRQLSEQESALQATRQNLEAIYQASGEGLALCQAIWDDDGRLNEYQVLEVNRAHAELTGATRHEMLSQRVSTIQPPVDPRWFSTAESVLKTGRMQDFDVRSRNTGRWLNIRVSRVSDDLFQQTFVDVSDRHRLEEQRAALLKEMNHRVLNNFQMVAGFLHLQASAADPTARNLLQTAERRVHVLARLHSFLAYTESEGEIDAAAYVQELCSHLGSMIDRPGDVRIVCDLARFTLPTEKIVPLGFVISELVTNSVKYAYPAPTTGVIRVGLNGNGEAWTLTVSDDGRGLDDAADPGKTGGLGSRLVDRFVQQIGATLTTTCNGGVHHVIVFAPAP